jgi:hypothetical protein
MIRRVLEYNELEGKIVIPSCMCIVLSLTLLVAQRRY